MKPNAPSTLLSLFLALQFMFLGLSPTRASGLRDDDRPAPRSTPDPLRDPGGKLVLVTVRGEHDREAARELGTIVDDYGPFVVVAVASGNAHKVGRGGSTTGLDAAELETTISLRSFVFEPLAGDPAEAFEPAGPIDAVAKAGSGLHLVQFVAPVRDAWLADLTAMGVEVIQYVPHLAFLVRGTPTMMKAVAEHPRVRWTGPYRQAHKFSADLMWVYGATDRKPDETDGRTTANFGKDGKALYDISVSAKSDLKAVANAVTSVNGSIFRTIELPNNYFNVLRTELSPESLKDVAGIEDVIAIDPWIQPVAEDERANHIASGNFTGNTIAGLAPPGYNPTTQFGVNGMTVTVGVVDDGVGIPGDGGFYVTAANTVNAPLRGASAGAQGHGHLQASIIAGTTPFGGLDPLSYNYGSGVAPAANIVNIPLLRAGYTGVEADTINDGLTTLGPNGSNAWITNNSFGAGTNGNTYDSLAAQYDGFVRDGSSAMTIDPALIIFSAGNSGASGLTRPKVAKNLIATASSRNTRPELASSTNTTNNLQDLSSFSSLGPAADTRVKPDITAPGDTITGGRSGPDVLFGNIDTFHRYSSGTSHAAPIVAGAAALFTNFWRLGHAGANPSPALVKAALINGAVDMTGLGATAAIPNGGEGWGRLNIANVLNTGVPTEYVNQTSPLTTVGQMAVFSGTVQNATRPFRVSLVWTDPPAISDPALVNNLDLEVTVGGNTYRGNVFTGGISQTGGTADIRNNVENVFLPAGIPVGTAFTIRVTATGLNGDGILGDADTTDQHFSLVAFNAAFGSAAVIAAAGATITAESCSPANNALDPGETVTVNFGLQNVGTLNTTNLVATLQATGGVTSPSGPQNYGAVVAGGPAVTRPFTFTVDPMLACGATLTATLQLQDGATNLGTVTFVFTLGTTTSSTMTFANTGAILIPAGAPGTTSGTANPYPANLAVAGMTGNITKVTARLRNMNHTFPDDIDVLLVGPAGQSCILMSDTGTSLDIVNITLTLDDAAATPLPDAAQLVSGTFRPTNIGAADTFAAPAPAGPYGTTLAAFNGTNPNGNWRLFVVDDLGGDSGNINLGYELTITTGAPVCSTCACTMTCPANITVGNDPGQCGAVVSYPTPTVTGGCGAPVCLPVSGSLFPIGTTTVNCTATGAAPCSFTVTVNDSEPPSIACPANVTAGNDAGQCSAVVNFVTPTPSDNCPGATVACVPATGSTFPVGTTTVTCTATDAATNTATCSFTVTVNDTQPPTITCPANVTVPNDAGQCSAVANFVTPTPSDNCPGATVACVPVTGSTFPIGTTTVTCTTTDAAMNTATCSFTVTVNDTQAPAITCPANITVPATQGTACAASAVVNYPAPTVSDNCPGTTTVCVPASGSVFPEGTTTVTCTATDAVGNTATCSFTVTVGIAFGVCLVGDGTGDTFSIVVDTASPFYGTWRYRVAATGEVFCGTASHLSYVPTRSLIAADIDDPVAFMNANVSFGSNAGTVTVTHRATNRQFRLRDRNLANDPPCM